MSAIQDISTAVGLASGVVGLVSGGFGLYDRFHKPSKQATPVSAGRYPPAQVAPPPAPRRPAPGLPETLPRHPQQQYGAASPPAPGWAMQGQQPIATLPHARPRRWLTHPGILVSSGAVILLYVLAGRITTAPPTLGVRPITGAGGVTLVILALCLYVVTVVAAAVQAVRLRRFGWMLSVIVIVGYGVFGFGLFGPTTQPGRH